MSRRRLARLRRICFARLGGASQNISFELSCAASSEKLQEEERSLHPVGMTHTRLAGSTVVLRKRQSPGNKRLRYDFRMAKKEAAAKTEKKSTTQFWGPGGF